MRQWKWKDLVTPVAITPAAARCDGDSLYNPRNLKVYCMRAPRKMALLAFRELACLGEQQHKWTPRRR